MLIRDALARRGVPKREVQKREIEMMLQHVLGISRASVIAHPERALTDAQATQLEQMLSERERGVPMAYIIGMREFYGRTFAVSPDVLIPRPETELLVDQVLADFSEQQWLEMPSNKGVSPSIIDLGTGSGAIAISISLEAPHLKVTATDVSRAALEIAKKNAQTLNAKIEFIESDWFTNLSNRKFDCIVSNPPYVAYGDKHLSEGDLRFEPVTALTDNAPDQGGLACIRQIIEQAPRHLNDNGLLLFEHGYDQAPQCRELLVERGFSALFCINDLAGIPRVSGGRWIRESVKI